MDKREQVEAFLTGTLTANVYDESGKLVGRHVANNVVTTNGINRLIDVIIDGCNQTNPLGTGDYTSNNWQLSTLSNNTDFNSQNGEIFGVNVLNWTGKSKSTFLASSNLSYITGYVDNTDVMFGNNPYLYANWHDGEWNTYWCPNGQTGGWIADLGLTTVTNETFTAPDIANYYALQNKNLKVSTLTLKNSALTTTYTSGTDYLWTTGDGDNYGTIKLLNASLIGATLKATYQWFDVPQVPIVGFVMDAGANLGATGWSSRSFFHSFRWSLDQGNSRTNTFLPNWSGSPRGPGWTDYLWDVMWTTGLYITDSVSHSYFMHHLPWAVKNPTQIAFFGNNQDQDKYVFRFDLLGYKVPKLGLHGIALGTGTGTPSQSDTALFNPSIQKVTVSKNKDSSSNFLTLNSYLDFNEGNGQTFTEAGLLYPSSDSVYFNTDKFWSGSTAAGGSGFHSPYISGTNGILRLDSIDPGDLDQLATHAMFNTPWTKNSSQRVELIYTLNITWS